MSIGHHTHQATGGSAYSVAAPAKKKFVAKGHDAQLQHAQFGKLQVEVVRISTDEPLIGTIARRDKYTITINHYRKDLGAWVDSIVYKHAIESVTTLAPAEVH